MHQLLWVFILFSAHSFAQTIEAIEFVGLNKTNEQYLTGVLNTKVGDSLSQNKLDSDLAFLERLNYFFSIDTTIQKSANSVQITFHLQEASSLYPVFFISGFKDQLRTTLGFNEIHFRGRFERLGFQHQYYDRHSFSAFYQAPFWNQKWGGKAYASKYSTIEPLYGMDTTSLFNFDNYSLQLGVHRWIKRQLKIGLLTAGFREFYEQLDDADLGLNRKKFQFTKYQVKMEFDWNQLRYQFEKVSGWRLKTKMETVQTIDFPAASFLKADFKLSGFGIVGQRHNFASLLFAGLATNRFSPFSPFVIDGFINVRGIGNRIERGTGIFGSNVEWRCLLFEQPSFYLQSVGFLDIAQVRPPGSQQWNSPSSWHYSLGAGLRLHARKWYRTILRIDAGFWTSQKSPGVAFGFEQFF